MCIKIVEALLVSIVFYIAAMLTLITKKCSLKRMNEALLRRLLYKRFQQLIKLQLRKEGSRITLPLFVVRTNKAGCPVFRLTNDAFSRLSQPFGKTATPRCICTDH